MSASPRFIDGWRDSDLRVWLGEQVFVQGMKIFKLRPPRLARDEPDFLEAVFEDRQGSVRTMLQPAAEPIRSRFSCTCPAMDEGTCPHVIALVLFARRLPEKVPVKNASLEAAMADLRARADAAKAAPPPRTAPTPSASARTAPPKAAASTAAAPAQVPRGPAGPADVKAAMADLRARSAAAKATEAKRMLAFKLIVEEGKPLAFHPVRMRPESNHVEAISAAGLLEHAPPYVDEAATALLARLRPYFMGGRFQLSAARLRGWMPELRAAHTFLRDASKPLQWSDDVGGLRFQSRDHAGGLVISGEAYDSDGKTIALFPGTFVVSAGEHAWLFDGARRFYLIASPNLAADTKNLLGRVLPGPLAVRKGEIRQWAVDTLPLLESWGKLQRGDSILPEVIRGVAPQPVALIEERGDILYVTAAVRYPPGETLVTVEDANPGLAESRRWYVRDVEAERVWFRELDARLGSEERVSKAKWILRGDRAMRFLDLDVAELEGTWEIFGRETLSGFQLSENELTPRVHVSSGIDWFETQFEFTAGDESFDVWKLLSLYDKNVNYIVTGGGYVRLPVELLKTLRERLAELPENGVVSRSQAGLLAAALHDIPNVTVDQGWREVATALQVMHEPETIAPHEALQATLRPYQQRGLDWLIFLARNRFGGILADDMGLGKTLQAIAFLLHQKEQLQQGHIGKVADADGAVADENAVPVAPRAGTLVVAPSSVVFNWDREVKKFAPSLSVLRWTGDQRAEQLDALAGADIVLTSYGVLRRDVGLFAGYRWRALILDEAQAIKNAHSQTAQSARVLSADFKLALTGTPIENHLGELWSYFEFVMPGFFGSEKKFQERYVRNFGEVGSDAAPRLRKRISPFILRRLKQQVAAELPPKSEIVIPCQLGPGQRNLYEMIRAAYRVSLFDRIEKEGLAKSKLHVLEALLRLRQACCDPSLVPYDEAETLTESAKREALLELVHDAVEEDHKIIIFSQFTKMLDRLGRMFDEEGLPFVRLDGSTEDREGVVSRFQTDPECRIFLISLRAGGVGLNLTAADYVVHYDPWWNPAVEDQATDRAYRIGQTRPVFVYRLIAENTVEERMLEMQQAKRGLVDTLLSDGDVATNLTLTDLREIFGAP